MKVSRTKFENPEDGMYDAVLVDVVDLGVVEGQFGPKQQVNLVWELNAMTSSGVPFTVRRRFTPSLHERSNLFKTLNSWLGSVPDELDLEDLIGDACRIVVRNVQSSNGTFPNVENVLKAGPTPYRASGGYVRVKDREESAA